MKILVIGQCQGGNAFLWKEFLENNLQEFPDIDYVNYICKNAALKEFDINAKNASLIKMYGNKWRVNLFDKIKNKLVSDYFALPKLKKIYLDQEYDIVHIQGLYEVSYVNQVLDEINSKSVIHIYGSDFYQKYLKGTKTYKEEFERAINKADQILFNFRQIQHDFLKHIPVKEKTTLGCMGVSGSWSGYDINKKNKNDKIRFLSARALYRYNNVENLVDAFINIYSGNDKYELWLVNGYGWDEDVKNRIKLKIKNHSNIIDLIGEWINDDELQNIYDQSDYNFCIGDTDQMTVSILYGYLRGCVNVITKLDSYKELDDAGFKTHFYLEDVNNIEKILKNLPEVNQDLLLESIDIAEDKFLFSRRFENTYTMYKTLVQ
jgi:hypothetical protein